MICSILDSPNIGHQCLCNCSNLEAFLETKETIPNRINDLSSSLYLENLSNHNNDDENEDETTENNDEDVRWG